jgi:histone-lysine N-methyltransferase SETMAR
MRKEFADNYEHQNDTIEYILENILQPSDESEEYKELERKFYSILANGCECQNDCNSSCTHGGNYEMIADQLLLKDKRKCFDLIYECNDSCQCPKDCVNRLVQYGPCDHLEIRKFNAKGFGLTTLKSLPKGSFICEYAGEILTKREAQKRDEENREFNKMNYIFCLNEMKLNSDDKIQTFIDPSVKGNIGRYLNHSCEPNCDIISVRCNSIIPKLAIFSNREIKVKEELTFSYGDVENLSSKKPCHCNAENCKKFLPNLGF